MKKLHKRLCPGILRQLVCIPIWLGAAGPAPAITFTEIHYDPPGTPEEKGKLKFIEIFNDGSSAVELSGYHFGEGVVFEFPSRTYLGGRKYLVLCADADTIRARYGIQNVIGNFTGNLSANGDKLVLLDPGGALAAQVDYSDRGKWTSVPTGTGYSLSLRGPYLDNGRPENWTRSGLPGGTPGGENFPPPYIKETVVFPEASEWAYRKGWDGAAMAPFSDPPEAWQAPAFDDSLWERGLAPIGFGDTEDKTLLTDMKGNYVAFAARIRFNLDASAMAQLENLTLKIRLDDGYVAYLNGKEIGRINVGTVGTDPLVFFDKAATVARELSSAALQIKIPKDNAVEGENVLAIQVHNRTLTEADAGLVAGLVWQKSVLTNEGPVAPLRLNEVLREPGTGGQQWLEVHNIGDNELDIGGFFITDDPAMIDRFTVPSNVKVQAGGYAVFNEADLGFPLSGTGMRRELRLYIFEPDRATVADAAILEMLLAAGTGPLSQCRIPDGGAAWLISPTPTREGPNEIHLERGVVINEIMYNPLMGPVTVLPSGKAIQSGEYLELYNRSDRSIPLAGWALRKGYNYFFPQDTVLEPGAYLVVAPDPEYIHQTYSLPLEKILGPANTPEARSAFGTLSNSGETILLEDPLSNPVQEIRYADGGQWSPFADGGGSSLELIDPAQDGSIPSAWGPSDETHKSTWKEYTYTGNFATSLYNEFWFYLFDAGDCLIDDVSVKKGTTEYIQNGGFEATMTSVWRLLGTHHFSKRITDEAHSGLACLLISASDGGDNRVNLVATDLKTSPGSGAMTVSFWARWLKGGRRIETSTYNSTALALSQLLDVPADLGTPGKENSLRAALRTSTLSDNLGPVVTDVRHSPAVPKSTESVTVWARVSDADGVKDVQVEYRIGRKIATLKTAQLFDDGNHGDGAPGDGVYAGTIPPQASNAKVLFDIAATDQGDRVRYFPVDAPAHTLLYQVNVPIESLALRYRLILDDDNLSTLQTQPLHSDDLVDGVLVFEESESYYNIGARYHGSPWNRPPDPKMFRLHFNGDKPLRGASKINISRYASAPNEGTANQLLGLASGGPEARTPRTYRYNYLKFYFNGAPHPGTAMGEIIPPGGDYFRVNFPTDSDGFLYKITGKLSFNNKSGWMDTIDWTRYRYYGPSKENFRYYYNPGSRQGEDNFDPLMKFLTVMDPSKTPLAKFESPTEGLESVMNVEAFLRVFIIRALQDDWDTIGLGNGQNAYVYYAPVEDRFYLLPWDMDHTFGNTGAVLAPAELNVDSGISRMVNQSGKYRRLYLRLMKEIQTGFWSAAALTPWLDMVNTEMKGLVGDPSGIKGFMTGRVAALKSKMPQLYQNILFAITSPVGGKDLAVKASVATIGGTSPFEIVRFMYTRSGGDLVEIEPTWPTTTGKDWKMILPLERGKNTFQLFGFDAVGSLIGGPLSIDIYDATDWPAPTVTAIDPAKDGTAGGASVTITGTGFQDNVAVVFDKTAAATVELVSATEIRAIAPKAASVGPVDLKVTNLDGQSATLVGGFTYETMFIRGDVDQNGMISITDATGILTYMFDNANLLPVFLPTADNCLIAFNIDGSTKKVDVGGTLVDMETESSITVTDAVNLLQFLFQGGRPPAEPFGTPLEPACKAYTGLANERMRCTQFTCK